MPKSEAYARIKVEVLATVAQVPAGRVCTYAAIGRHLDVMARHVAYILATLTEEERSGLPWHRIIAASGLINRTKLGRGAEQRAKLEAEGVVLAPSGKVVDLARVCWSPGDS